MREWVMTAHFYPGMAACQASHSARKSPVWEALLLCLFYRWKNWGSEVVYGFPKATQPVTRKASIPSHAFVVSHFMHVCAKSLQLCPILCSPVDCSPPALLSMGFSRQEYWSGLPFPPPGDLPDPGVKPMSCLLYWQAGSLPLVPLGSRIAIPTFVYSLTSWGTFELFHVLLIMERVLYI